jgi:hypothetical protein
MQDGAPRMLVDQLFCVVGGLDIARSIDQRKAAEVLKEEFDKALDAFRYKRLINVPTEITKATEILMRSNTQAYREALIGCALARIVDDRVDIHMPHTRLGENAFSGRSLDENVVNPFLQRQEIPCSRGPYLSALRRGVVLQMPVPEGQRDRQGFESLVAFVDSLRKADEEKARQYLRYLLYGFLKLREESRIELMRVAQLDLEQYRRLLHLLLGTPSGGRIPMMIVVSIFQAVQQYFELDWGIEWQEINAADIAQNAGGDVTIKRDGEIVLAVEVTERLIGEERVRATFRTKISPLAIDEYLFLFTFTFPSDEARQLAKQYFAQGHHVAFLAIEDWSVNILSLIGPEGRTIFNARMLEMLARNDVPRDIKVAWNQHLEMVVTGRS